jgi:hypothetical protein
MTARAQFVNQLVDLCFNTFSDVFSFDDADPTVATNIRTNLVNNVTTFLATPSNSKKLKGFRSENNASSDKPVTFKVAKKTQYQAFVAHTMPQVLLDTSVPAKNRMSHIGTLWKQAPEAVKTQCLNNSTLYNAFVDRERSNVDLSSKTAVADIKARANAYAREYCTSDVCPVPAPAVVPAPALVVAEPVVELVVEQAAAPSTTPVTSEAKPVTKRAPRKPKA